MGILTTPTATALSIPLASDSVQAAAGSPPYLALRRYGKQRDETPVGAAWMDWPAVEWSPLPGEPLRTAPPWPGQLGHEPDPGLYVAHLVAMGREVRRVLHETGVFWLNVGDSYATTPRGNKPGELSTSSLTNPERQDAVGRGTAKAFPVAQGNALLIPHRVAMAFQADGWILRSAVTWSANRLPESVSGWRWERCRVKAETIAENVGNGSKAATGRPQSAQTAGSGPTFLPRAIWSPCPGCPKCESNGGYILRRGSWRPTRSVEMLFMFAKSADYWASGEGVREGYSPSPSAAYPAPSLKQQHASPRGRGNMSGDHRRFFQNGGRNLRDVWYITTEPSKLAHYAGWPGALARRLIQCSTPDAGCCRKCGVPWSQVVERNQPPPTGAAIGDAPEKGTAGYRQRDSTGGGGNTLAAGNGPVLGWLPSCDCNPLPPAPLAVAEARKLTCPALVLDPFGGTGVTAREARAMGRSAVSVDPILSYCQMARDNAGSGCLVARERRPRALAPIFGPLFAAPEEGVPP